jgi:DNA-binding transcriptional ArsR family regulator
MNDVRVLRAIAHPVRNRILSEMAATGPTRAADIARDLGIPANQASFHLRQLAKYGLVEEAADEGRDRRDRVWRLVAPEGFALDMGTLEQEPGGKAAVSVFRQQSAAWAHQVVEAAYSPEHEPGTMQSVTSQAIKLTKEEARDFNDELEEVVLRWAERTRGRDESRRTYLLLSLLLPHSHVDAITGEDTGGEPA